MTPDDIIRILGMLPPDSAYDARSGEVIFDIEKVFKNNLNVVRLPFGVFMCGKDPDYYKDLPDMLAKTEVFHQVMQAVTAHPKYMTASKSLDLLFFECYHNLFEDSAPHDHRLLASYMSTTYMATLHTYNKIRMPYIVPPLANYASTCYYAIDCSSDILKRRASTTEEFLAIDAPNEFRGVECLNIYTPGNYDHSVLVEKLKEINLPVILSLVP